MKLISKTPAWSQLADHAAAMQRSSLRELFAQDADRWQKLHIELGDWLFDFSRQRITSQTLQLLTGLARSVDLEARIAAMYRGDKINVTEDRAVLHVALRTATAGGAGIQNEVHAERTKLQAFVAAVREGRELGAGGKRFKHIVNIGIGGSDLGPLLVCDALRHEWSAGVTPHFVSNVDRTQLDDFGGGHSPRRQNRQGHND